MSTEFVIISSDDLFIKGGCGNVNDDGNEETREAGNSGGGVAATCRWLQDSTPETAKSFFSSSFVNYFCWCLLLTSNMSFAWLIYFEKTWYYRPFPFSQISTMNNTTNIFATIKRVLSIMYCARGMKYWNVTISTNAFSDCDVAWKNLTNSLRLPNRHIRYILLDGTGHVQ